MKFINENSDEATLAELGERITRTRLNANQTQGELAGEAGVSLRTLQRLEGGGSVQLVNLVRVLRALNLLENLEALVPGLAASPIQQLSVGGKERRRASSAVDPPDRRGPWRWGDEE